MSDILIADDHPLFRDALSRAVQTGVPDATVQAVTDVYQLFDLVETCPDAELLLLDIHIPGARGFSALVHVRAQYPELPVIVISAHEERTVAERAMTHGAVAYIPKSASAANIATAIHSVLDGDTWLPETMHGTVAVRCDAAEAAAAQKIATLTPQQFRVMALVTDGKLNKQIAWDIGVSEATVKAHMTAIMRKLGVNNRTQVALIANELEVEQVKLTG